MLYTLLIGANMTVGFNATKFDQFTDGGQIGAFYDLDGDGTLNVWRRYSSRMDCPLGR